MKATCRDFEAAVDRAVGLPDLASVALAQLYARLIRIHPFGDGNGRTAWVTLQLAAGRLEMPLVKSAPSLDAKLALGDALLDGERLEPLAHVIRVAAYDDGA